MSTFDYIARPKTLSFCITCKNRFRQIKETLPRNLEDNAEDKNGVEFILVDFGSTDGLQSWVAETFEKEIDEGYLKYFYTEELPFWHASVAKNTAHILANHEILANLDCDNYTGIRGGKFLIDQFENYNPDNTVFHQFSNNYSDGSYGRIAMTKNLFLMVGGYDENLEPMGYQDTDLLVRLAVVGKRTIHLGDPTYNRAIFNTKAESMDHVKSDLDWESMNIKNLQSSYKNITTGKIVANQEKDHIGIIDNIYTF